MLYLLDIVVGAFVAQFCLLWLQLTLLRTLHSGKKKESIIQVLWTLHPLLLIYYSLSLALVIKITACLI